MCWILSSSPPSPQNLSRDPISLTFLSEDILLANKRLFSAEQTSLHFIPFTNVGYDTMLLLITVDAPFGAPSLIYNRANPPPASWFADMVGSYRGNSGALERTGSLPINTRGNRFKTTRWTYADGAAWVYRNLDNEAFIPQSTQGIYEPATALWDMDNPGKANRRYTMTFTLPDNFDFSVKYRYLESVYNRRRFSPLTTGSHNNDFTYTYKGKQLRATKTQTVTAYGYDLVDLTDVPVTLFTIPNTPHTTQTKIINTNKRYVVLRCSTAYQIAETDLTESLVDAAEFEADNSVAVFDIPADPNAGISAFFQLIITHRRAVEPALTGRFCQSGISRKFARKCPHIPANHH